MQYQSHGCITGEVSFGHSISFQERVVSLFAIRFQIQKIKLKHEVVSGLMTVFTERKVYPCLLMESHQL